MTPEEQRLYEQIVSDVLKAITLRTEKIQDGLAAKRAAIIAGVALETVAKSINDVVLKRPV